MPKKPLLVYLDDEDRTKLELLATEEATSASPVARRILHQALADVKLPEKPVN